MPPYVLVFIVLAVTQTIGWGVVGILPVLAPKIATELNLSIPTIFFGTSILFIVMGLASPAAGGVFLRFGTRTAMSAGAALVGVGLGLIGLATTPLFFFGAWFIVGLGGAIFLTTPAYLYLTNFDSARARSTIGLLMLVTGLAGAIFWPITAALEPALGWRGTVFAYGAALVVFIAPLLFLGLPETAGHPVEKVGHSKPIFNDIKLQLLMAAIALNGFVTFGLEAVGIELFRALGTDLGTAVLIASLLGVFKIVGRLIEVFGDRRINSVAAACVSCAFISAGLLAVCVGGSALWSIAVFVVLVGIGSGVFAVSRATLPLVLFEKADYAAAMTTLALPLNLMNALAAPVLAVVLVNQGPIFVLGMATVLSGGAMMALLALSALHPHPSDA